MVLPRPIIVGPLITTCGPMIQPSPMLTSGPIRVHGPMFTFFPIDADGSIITVESITLYYLDIDKHTAIRLYLPTCRQLLQSY